MNDGPLHDEVLPLRAASRHLVRELGFLQAAYTPAGLAHSHCHALIELEAGCASQGELASRLRLDKSTTSRVVARLVADGWAKPQRNPQDRRQAALVLTAAGRKKVAEIHAQANATVQGALDLLSPQERAAVLHGMRLYARALGRARARARHGLRRIRRGDDAGVAAVIRTVMPEFGASGPGFAIHDPEVDAMFASYGKGRAAYFVVTEGADIVGGGGVAPLAGGDPATCELRKMYFLPHVRGLGFGQELLERCLDAARQLGFERCYLETLKSMRDARALYEKNGFRPLPGPLGATGHFGCDAWYARALALD